MAILNLHRTDTVNTGDLASAPSLYFDLRAERLDLYRIEDWLPKLATAEAVIVGGGGLLNSPFFKPALDTLFRARRPETKIIIWGAGHNVGGTGDHASLTFKPDHRIDQYALDLIGVRDINYPYQWVPCASCMNPLFDVKHKITRDVVIYSHTDTADDYLAQCDADIPVTRNGVPLQDALAFMGSANLVLTNSFHGAYWATLLGRRVVSFVGNSRVSNLKHKVPIGDIRDWRLLAKLAVHYPGALEECRNENRWFAKRVFKMLGDA